MTHITINDLQHSMELDTRALAGIQGGQSDRSARMAMKMAAKMNAKMAAFGAFMSRNPYFKQVSNSLNNIVLQINIAVNSQNVVQANAVNVVQQA